MIRKRMAYLTLLNTGINQNQDLSRPNGKAFGLIAGLWIWISLMMGVFLCFGINLGVLGYLYIAMIGVSMVFGNRIRGELHRSLPVEESFAVTTVLFYAPIILIIPVLLSFGVLALFWFSIISDGMFFYFQRIQPVSCLIGFLLVASMWFLCCAGAFHKSTRVKVCWFGAILISNMAFLLGTAHMIYKGSYQGELGILDMIGYYPVRPMLLGSVCLFIASGVFAFRYSKYLLRHDVYGQRTTKQKKVEETENSSYGVIDMRLGQMSSGERKNVARKTVVVAGVCIVFCILSVWGAVGPLFGDGENKSKVNLEYDSVSDYDKWETIEDDIQLGKELRWSNLSNRIFPEKPVEQDVEYYHAGVNGSFEHGEDGGWSDLHYYRVLVQQLPQAEYQKEKERVAGLRYTYQGEEKVQKQWNGTLKDTRNFSGEAYIAVFNSRYENYEYAIFHDDRQQVIYVYGNCVNPSKYAPGYDVLPKLFSPVITMENANTGNVGYSIYSFYNEEDGFYTED